VSRKGTRKMVGDGKSPLKPKAGLNGALESAETVRVIRESRGGGDPSLRLKSGSARDDAESDGISRDNVDRDDAEAPVDDYGVVIPWLMAVAEGKWWERVRRDPKRSGEISQAAFLLKARMMGFKIAIPWGDSERYDFIVWAREGGRFFRVQVKGTGRLHRRGYEVQPVHSTRGQGKRRYSKKDIDVLVGHVQPVDAWYLIPIEKVGRAKSLRFYPDIAVRRPRWEEWREKWAVIEK